MWSSVPCPTALRRTHHQDSVCEEHETAHKDDHGVLAIERGFFAWAKVSFSGSILSSSIFSAYKDLYRRILCLSHSLGLRRGGISFDIFLKDSHV